MEALEVIPEERQELLPWKIETLKKFSQLEDKLGNELRERIKKKQAEPWLLNYYANDQLEKRNDRAWNNLQTLINLYWELASRDPALATVLCKIAKYAFIKNAEVRFELLRTFWENLVRYQRIKLSFPLLAEYVRLIQTDGLALEKYPFLKQIEEDVSVIFRERKPRLTDEYILEKEYYLFDETDKQRLIRYFRTINYSDTNLARRFQVRCDLPPSTWKYFTIELDIRSRYFVRAIRREVSASGGNVVLNFSVKHTKAGFLATAFHI